MGGGGTDAGLASMSERHNDDRRYPFQAEYAAGLRWAVGMQFRLEHWSVPMGIVTLSAAYAAGGSEIGPRVAHRLGMRFIDRAIPVGVARGLGISVEEAEAVAQNAPSRLWQLLAGMSSAGYGMVVPEADQRATERQLINQTETRIREEAEAGNCLILGHAAAVVLANSTDTLHVRLDGAPEGRIKAAMRQHGLDHHTAEAAQRENDKVRTGYVKHFYQADSASPKLYDLVLDTVRLGWGHAEELIVTAARLTDASTQGS